MRFLQDLADEALEAEMKSVVAETLDLWLRDDRMDVDKLKQHTRKIMRIYQRMLQAQSELRAQLLEKHDSDAQTA